MHGPTCIFWAKLTPFSLKRYRILVERRCFPSDEYAVQSQALLHGLDPADAILYFERREARHPTRIT